MQINNLILLPFCLPRISLAFVAFAKLAPVPSGIRNWAITRRVVSIDFYRLIDKIDKVYVIDIDSYRFIKRFSDIDCYRLPTSSFCTISKNGEIILVVLYRRF